MAGYVLPAFFLNSTKGTKMVLLESIPDLTLHTWLKAMAILIALYIPAAYVLIWIRSAEPSFKDCDSESCPLSIWDERLVT